ncbi:hypothetical protein PCASD_04035 [Puccinia coronata f. sp. avenae]|uniref:BED-type domain-containing protein n=1 Tax=Puccinia coronata f. sp. avenae TaxID=200324 RepID=A0A2N5V5I1_9BASI|nr:hypothetical protein PCASD_04035 [Puccinia coronata f. sp. avenae]
MVTPSADSCIRLTAQKDPEQNQKRPAVTVSESVQSDSYCTNDSATKAQAKGKRKAKKNRTVTESTSRASTATVKTSDVATITKKGAKAKEKKSNKRAKANPTNEEYDYDQDSDNGSVTIAPRETKKKSEGFVNILDYFEAPVWKEGDKPNTAMNYKCKWCSSTYRAHESTAGNLKCHRDGSTQAGKNSDGCVNRDKAKKSGVNLPPSVTELRIAKTKAGEDKQPTINSFLQTKPTFVNRVLNQIIMIWQIRQALAWTRIKDPYLRAAFQYANNKALLYGWRWLADEAKKLYSMLKAHVFDELSKLDTKFTLIHDVWTTKGNRFAFIGAAVAFIDSEWEYCVRHLTLKMIPWKHYGHLLVWPIATVLNKNRLYEKMLAQTTDSGSNNNTMASAIYGLLNDNWPEKQSSNAKLWDPASMHICCFCHKIALIVNAGLESDLSLKTLPPSKAKESIIGFFPVLGTLAEEEETNDPAVTTDKNKTVGATIDVEETVDSNYGNADNEGSDAGSEASEKESND